MEKKQDKIDNLINELLKEQDVSEVLVTYNGSKDELIIYTVRIFQNLYLENNRSSEEIEFISSLLQLMAKYY
ncbi:hypothetical protein NSA33_03030 [Mammaliicoccus lentus]|uniref:hypothetical protein n=1 Tax=Mammaliicoccus lentus TaxID=42858 RepID=UPI00214A9B24|nr:hypothetical protein [Mammaliicoccus lentus]MCR1872125.1 hypothetical protein [Mammaliicoccus lentus]